MDEQKEAVKRAKNQALRMLDVAKRVSGTRNEEQLPPELMAVGSTGLIPKIKTVK